MRGESSVEAPQLSIVVPVYNERDNLEPLDTELRSVLGTLSIASEILYVNDASTDGSHEVLARLVDRAGGDIPTRVVHLRRNYGQTAAMSAGFELARGRVIVPLDADGQNNPADIPRLLAELEKGYDVVSGWRRDRKDRALSRKVPSRVANWLIGKVSGVRLHDYGCTLKAYRADLLQQLRLYGEMHRFIPLYLAQLGARVAELPVDHRPRCRGTSKYGLSRIYKVFLDLFVIRFMTRYYARPMHFFGQAAIGFLAAALFICCLMFVLKFGMLQWIGIDYQARFVRTPLPTVAATLFLGAVCSLFFGIQAEVLMRVHFESRGHRPYVVEGVTDSLPRHPRPRLAEIARIVEGPMAPRRSAA